MMRIIYLNIILLLIDLSCTSQEEKKSWIKGIGGSDHEESRGIVTDKEGNIYVTGECRSPVLMLGDTTLTAAHAQNIFIVKYNPSGKVLWGKSILYATGSDITIDTKENLYLIYSNQSGISIIKYNPSGNMLWTKEVTLTHGNSYKNEITCDANDNIYIAGGFDNNYIMSYKMTTNGNEELYIVDSTEVITFDSNTTLSTNVNSEENIFIAKYNSLGNALWAKFITNDVHVNEITTDAKGNLYLIGGFSGPSLTFDTITLTNEDIKIRDKVGYNTWDMFIAKYDPSGNIQWAKRADDNGESIAVDTKGSVYITGNFTDTITFGSISLINGDNNYSYCLFIVKYDSLGNVLWAKKEDDIYSGYSIAISGNENIYLLGGTVGIGSFFIRQYNSSGNPSVTTTSGEGDQNFKSIITSDRKGNVYMMGNFRRNIILDGNELTNAGKDYCDIFIARLKR